MGTVCISPTTDPFPVDENKNILKKLDALALCVSKLQDQMDDKKSITLDIIPPGVSFKDTPNTKKICSEDSLKPEKICSEDTSKPEKRCCASERVILEPKEDIPATNVPIDKKTNTDTVSREEYEKLKNEMQVLLNMMRDGGKKVVEPEVKQ
jgi:hypothetical protein